MGKTNNNNGIDYNDVKAYAKTLGINIVGRRKATAIIMVLDGIVAKHKKAKVDLSDDDFNTYKRENQAMLAWFNANRDWKPPSEDKPTAVAEDDQHAADNPEEIPAESVENDKPAEKYLDDDEKGKSEDKPSEDKPEDKPSEETPVEEPAGNDKPAEEYLDDDEKESKDRPTEEETPAEIVAPEKKGKDKAGGKKKDLAKTKDRVKKAKGKAGKKKAEKKDKKESSVEKDEYGFVIGTKRSLFCKEIAKKSCTMFNIRKMAWNDRMAGFYDLFGELQKKGLASRDFEGKMFMKKK